MNTYGLVLGLNILWTGSLDLNRVSDFAFLSRLFGPPMVGEDVIATQEMKDLCSIF